MVLNCSGLRLDGIRFGRLACRYTQLAQDRFTSPGRIARSTGVNAQPIVTPIRMQCPWLCRVLWKRRANSVQDVINRLGQAATRSDQTANHRRRTARTVIFLAMPAIDDCHCPRQLDVDNLTVTLARLAHGGLASEAARAYSDRCRGVRSLRRGKKSDRRRSQKRRLI